MTSDELDRSLRQLRLGGMADALSLRSQQARAENLGPLDFIGLLVHDELQRRRDRLVARRVKAAGFRDHKNARHIRLEVQRPRPSAHLRTRHRALHRATRRRFTARQRRRRQEPYRSGDRHGRNSCRLSRALSRGARTLRRFASCQRHRRAQRSDRNVQRDSTAHHR